LACRRRKYDVKLAPVIGSGSRPVWNARLPVPAMI
jgi:hypothetical protein